MSSTAPDISSELEQRLQKDVEGIRNTAATLHCKLSLKTFQRFNRKNKEKYLAKMEKRVTDALQKMDDENSTMETSKEAIETLHATINELLEQKEEMEKAYKKAKNSKGFWKKTAKSIQDVLSLFRQVFKSSQVLNYPSMDYPAIRDDAEVRTPEDIRNIGDNDSYRILRKLQYQGIEDHELHNPELKIKGKKSKGWRLEDRRTLIAGCLKIDMAPGDDQDDDSSEDEIIVDNFLKRDSEQQPPTKKIKTEHP